MVFALVVTNLPDKRVASREYPNVDPEAAELYCGIWVKIHKASNVITRRRIHKPIQKSMDDGSCAVTHMPRSHRRTHRKFTNDIEESFQTFVRANEFTLESAAPVRCAVIHDEFSPSTRPFPSSGKDFIAWDLFPRTASCLSYLSKAYLLRTG